MTHAELAVAIADDLFANGFDEHAEHLVLMTYEGRHLGAWSKGAVIQRLTKLLADVAAKEREDECLNQ